ncbi:NAD dehydrogenase [Lentinula aciculospora]|uniref:L-2-hydroxyglutarate dehydrogenase, mitochondrial n=1 Tax=Lentinula aciculospora TaxID=153920 RepID=A0A9W9DIH0_9AGAR|nr:NAD dehydrogenase [Lentinula aciculospora]
MKLPVRGLAAALNSSGKFKEKAPEAVVDHLVVGAGVVGLAIAQRLCDKFPSKSTYVVERHSRAGEETSSRNSEVIHSGIYYPADSFKTRLCLRGRELMYQRCRALDIPHRKTGKLIVAKANQRPYIENLHLKALKLQWPPYSDGKLVSSPVLPTALISGDEARAMEPNLSKDISAALWCPETGIVDSHSLMESLEKDILESEAGDLAYTTRVVRLDPYTSRSFAPNADAERGWVVHTVTGNNQGTESDAILARTVINASGLSAPFVLNTLLPQEQRIPMYYARGSYASYKGPGISGISHLIYPCPDTGLNAHAFASLGTHLTLDLNGKIRFGPDIEFLEPPSPDASEENMDYWTRHLIPDDSRLEQMHLAVKQYLPEVVAEGLQPDYVGIRPKLVPPGAGFQDFVFQANYPCQFGGLGVVRESPMISLLGIESPGLTSSLAIAEYVVDDLLSSINSAQ